MRTYIQRVYGITPEQVLESSVVTRYLVEDGAPRLVQEPKLFLHCNYGGKPVAIDLFIGKRPRAAFGKSTGDREMLQWVGVGDGAPEIACSSRRSGPGIRVWPGAGAARHDARDVRSAANG